MEQCANQSTRSSGEKEEEKKVKEDDGDYLAMEIVDTKLSKYETSAQRRAREKKEAEARSRPMSKADLAEEGLKTREDMLARKIDSSSKGFKLLSKLGYKPGMTLGSESSRSSSQAQHEPLGIEIKNNKWGVGLNAEIKRKFQETSFNDVKRVKLDEQNFIGRMSKEKEDGRNESLWHDAMKVLESIEEQYPRNGTPAPPESSQAQTQAQKDSKLPGKANILYRSLIRERALSENEKYGRRRFENGLLAGNDGRLEGHLGLQRSAIALDELDETDEELDKLETLGARERLEQVVQYLRKQHCYCYWCKASFHDNVMDGCPGPNEDDHN